MRHTQFLFESIIVRSYVNSPVNGGQILSFFLSHPRKPNGYFQKKNRLILWVIGKERLMINLYASSYDKECDRRWVIDTAQI